MVKQGIETTFSCCFLRRKKGISAQHATIACFHRYALHSDIRSARIQGGYIYNAKELIANQARQFQ